MEKDFNDMVVSLEVSNEELEKVKKGEIWLVKIGISKDNLYYNKLDGAGRAVSFLQSFPS